MELGVGIEKAKSELRVKSGGLQNFARRYIGCDIPVSHRLRYIRCGIDGTSIIINSLPES